VAVADKKGLVEIGMLEIKKGNISGIYNRVKFQNVGVITSLEFSPNGSRLVVGSVGEVIHMYSDHGVLIFKYSVRENSTERPAFNPVFSPDGSRLLVDGGECVCVLNTETGKTVLKLKPGVWSRTNLRPAFNQDGTRIVTGSPEGKAAYIWDANTGERLLTLQYPFQVTAIGWSNDGTKLAVGTADGTIEIRNAGPARKP
jgi:WD40 repeat protein